MLNSNYFGGVELRPSDCSHSNQLGQFANWAFMNEAEGWTRTARINHAIEEMKEYDGDVNFIWRTILSSHDVDPASLTGDEQRYINKMLAE